MSQETYTTKGVIHRILPRETRGKFDIQKFVVEVDGYKDDTELAVFELFGKNCDRIDPFREGEQCEVGWNIKGREHKGNFYSTMSAWKIVKPDQPHQRNSSSKPARDYKLDEPGQSPTAGRTYRGKNAYVPPADNSEDDLAF